MNTATVASDAFFSAVIKTKNSCKSTTKAGNEIRITSNAGKVLQNCMKKYTPQECAILGQTNVSGVVQSNSVQISNNCSIQSRELLNFQSLFANELQQKASVDKGLADIFGKNNLNNAQNIQNAVKGVFTSSKVNEIITKCISEQKMIFTNLGGQLNVVRVAQVAQVKAFTLALSQNETVMKMVSTADTSSTQGSSASSTSSNIMSAVAIICAILVAAIGAYMFFGGGK